ncbi:hypothetical protein DFH06DRAFT_724914 [Mycena polygramma]|nr:hypothetical protein DFH06DRAFT_724914 [Mycena polygramma]
MQTAQLVQYQAIRARACAPASASMSAPAFPATSTAALTSTSTSTSTSNSAFAHAAPVFPAPPAPPPAPAPALVLARADPFAKYTTPAHNPSHASSGVQQVRVDSETDERMGGVDADVSRFQAPAAQNMQQEQQQDAFAPQTAQTVFSSPSAFFPSSFTSTQQQDVFAPQCTAFTFSSTPAPAPQQTHAFASPSPPAYTYTPPFSPEHLQNALAQCASPAAYVHLAELAHAAGYAVDARALVEGAWMMGREEGGREVVQAMYGQEYAPPLQYAHAQQQNEGERRPTFSRLYGAHGCPAPRVRALEAEVDLPAILPEAAAQSEWWAAKAAESDRGFEGEADDEDEDEFDEREEEGVTVQQQTYAAVQAARQRAFDREAYARVGRAQRETFRNGYLALGMRYRGVRRARAEAAAFESAAAACEAAASAVAAPLDVTRDVDADQGGEEEAVDAASSSSSESGDEYADVDSDTDSAYSSSSRSSSPSSPPTRTYTRIRNRSRIRSSPYARTSRAAATARLVDSVVSFFGRLGV